MCWRASGCAANGNDVWRHYAWRMTINRATNRMTSHFAPCQCMLQLHPRIRWQPACANIKIGRNTYSWFGPRHGRQGRAGQEQGQGQAGPCRGTSCNSQPEQWALVLVGTSVRKTVVGLGCTYVADAGTDARMRAPDRKQHQHHLANLANRSSEQQGTTYQRQRG